MVRQEGVPVCARKRRVSGNGRAAGGGEYGPPVLVFPLGRFESSVRRAPPQVPLPLGLLPPGRGAALSAGSPPPMWVLPRSSDAGRSRRLSSQRGLDLVFVHAPGTEDLLCRRGLQIL